MLTNDVGGCADKSLFSLFCSCNFVVVAIYMLLFALYIIFIGLCYHQYNGNVLYNSCIFENDYIQVSQQTSLY